MLLPTASSSLIRSSMMTAMSSAGLRWDFVIDGTGSRTWTDRACGPRRPSATPKSTRVPGLGAVTPAGSAEACRKTSPPSSSEAMKPKPRSASNHLTLPVGTGTSDWSGPPVAMAGHRDCCRSQRIGTAAPAHPARGAGPADPARGPCVDADGAVGADRPLRAPAHRPRDIACRSRVLLMFGAYRTICLLYTSDAADDLLCVDLG